MVVCFAFIVSLSVKNGYCEAPPLPPCKIAGHVYLDNALLTDTQEIILITKYGTYQGTVPIDSSGKYSMIILDPYATNLELAFTLNQNREDISQPITLNVPEPGTLKVIDLKF